MILIFFKDVSSISSSCSPTSPYSLTSSSKSPNPSFLSNQSHQQAIKTSQVATNSKSPTINENYKPSGGNVKVFSEKLDFDAAPKISSINENYKKAGGDVKIFNEKVAFDGEARVDALNPNYKPNGFKLYFFVK